MARHGRPTAVTRSYVEDAVAPHTLAVRWSYTVPEGRWFELESYILEWVRNLIEVTTASTAVLIIQYTPADVALPAVHIDAFNETDPTRQLTPVRIKAGFPHKRVEAGGKLECLTQDVSVGGMYQYVCQMSGTEYDL